MCWDVCLLQPGSILTIVHCRQHTDYALRISKPKLSLKVFCALKILSECAACANMSCWLFPVCLSSWHCHMKSNCTAHLQVYCCGFILHSLWLSAHWKALHCPLHHWVDVNCISQYPPVQSLNLSIGWLLYCVSPAKLRDDWMIVYPSCGYDD